MHLCDKETFIIIVTYFVIFLIIEISGVGKFGLHSFVKGTKCNFRSSFFLGDN